MKKLWVYKHPTDFKQDRVLLVEPKVHGYEAMIPQKNYQELEDRLNKILKGNVLKQREFVKQITDLEEELVEATLTITKLNKDIKKQKDPKFLTKEKEQVQEIKKVEE